MTSRFVSALLAVGMVSAAPAAAQSLPGGAGGRYQMQPVEGGIVRLDTTTGAVELCRVEGDALVCKSSAGASGGAADRDRIADLEARVEALEGGKQVLKGADEAADHAIETMRQIFRGFADIVRELERDLETDPGETKGEAEPNRT